MNATKIANSMMQTMVPSIHIYSIVNENRDYLWNHIPFISPYVDYLVGDIVIYIPCYIIKYHVISVE